MNLRSIFMGLVPLFVLAHFSHHVLTALTVPLLPFIRNDFALDYTRSGMVISAFSLAYGIGFGALLLLLGVILMMRMPIAEAYIVSQPPEHFRSTILGIYSNLKNLVLWARSEQTGDAANKCSGMMEYWNVGIMG